MSILLHCEETLALAINEAICADAGNVVESRQLTARILSDPKVRAIIEGERNIGRAIGWEAAKRDTSEILSALNTRCRAVCDNRISMVWRINF